MVIVYQAIILFLLGITLWTAICHPAVPKAGDDQVKKVGCA